MTRRGARTNLSRRISWVLLAGMTAVAMVAPAHAEDLKGRWYFGGHLGYLSTSDDIRSNAGIIIGPLGDDNIPFTGDPNEVQECVGENTPGSLPYCDPRPDDLLSRETAIEETFRYEIEAGFGLTSWLSLQLDASYFKGDVGPIDTFVRQHYPVVGFTGQLTSFVDEEKVLPLEAGQITEIPVSLTGIVRFRKDSPLNPYVGVGFGMIFASVDRSQDVDDFNSRATDMRIRAVSNEFNEEVTRARFGTNKVDGTVPFRNHRIEVGVNDAFEWHLTAGAEYFFNDRLSLIFDARYMFADDSLRINLGGEDQINLLIFSEQMFRPDGTTRYFAPSAAAPNTSCEDINWDGLGCDPFKQNTGTFVNPSGKDYRTGPRNCDDGDPLNGIEWETTCQNRHAGDPAALAQCLGAGYQGCIEDDRNWNVAGSCPRSGDFDRNGSIDLCYGTNVGASPAGFREPRGDVAVQGGDIKLTAFSVAIGLRFHF